MTSQWLCKNDENFVAAENCYKIITCDPLDDTIDQFTNVMAGAAERTCKNDYSTNEYLTFFKNLRYLQEFEKRTFDELSEE